MILRTTIAQNGIVCKIYACAFYAWCVLTCFTSQLMYAPFPVKYRNVCLQHNGKHP